VRRLAGRWLHRRARTPAGVRLAAAILCAGFAVTLLSAQATQGAAGPAGTERVLANKQAIAPAPGEMTAPIPSSPALIAQGQRLYANGCSSCHGLALQGRRRVAPALIGVGAGPVDFYLSTGRMPLSNPRDAPLRSPAKYSRTQIDALVSYVSSFGGPPAPDADPSKGDLALGLHLFTLNCAGCHQMVARGGLTVGAVVPSLLEADSRQVAEAVRMGPYVMPHFNSKQIDQHGLDSLARYVLWTHHPDNAGGWGIYNLGPIPEGMAAWFLLALSLVLFARLIGERTT